MEELTANEANNTANLNIYSPVEAKGLKQSRGAVLCSLEDTQSAVKVVATSDNEGKMLCFKMLNSLENSLW